jgi:hypothetical protein
MLSFVAAVGLRDTTALRSGAGARSERVGRAGVYASHHPQQHPTPRSLGKFPCPILLHVAAVGLRDTTALRSRAGARPERVGRAGVCASHHPQQRPTPRSLGKFPCPMLSLVAAVGLRDTTALRSRAGARPERVGRAGVCASHHPQQRPSPRSLGRFPGPMLSHIAAVGLRDTTALRSRAGARPERVGRESVCASHHPQHCAKTSSPFSEDSPPQPGSSLSPRERARVRGKGVSGI